MSVDVAAGAAFILGTETTYQGTYYFQNDATVNMVIAASDPTNPRNDLVVAQVRDANYSGASNDARLFVVTGTPNASPVDPTVPADTLTLARVRVDATVTSIVAGKVTDLRVRGGAQAQLPKLSGVVGGVVNGVPTLAAAGFLVQAGTSVVTTDGASNATVVYPVPFPNGVVTVLAAAGDITASFTQVRFVQSGQSLSQFVCQCFTNAGGTIFSNHRGSASTGSP